ncbi:hypothetical protein AAGV33_08575 [Flavobacterium sp. FBOR7N2.3]|uniref:Uncharacterized protein n=1 Tax=Flavobacterium magnesitis TaxID=3138077 RepID=A0ABV4TKF1_9FLAO
METNNSESKKLNDTQNNNEKSQDKDVSTDTASKDTKLNKELDVDADGKKNVVDRARDGYENSEKLSDEIDSDNPNAKRGVTTDKEAMKTVENKDLNSDITPNRYPNSHPDNKKDRGNMKLDE